MKNIEVTMKNTFRLVIAVLLLGVSFAPGVARADHVFNNVCADGQELRLEGFTAWRVSILYRLVSWNGEAYYHESYFEHNDDEGWGLHFLAEVRDVPSWERVSDVQVIAPNGLHHVWLSCFDGDLDSEYYGPIYRG